MTARSIDGYFDALIQFINECNIHGFLSESDANIPKCYQTVLSFLDDIGTVNKSENIQTDVDSLRKHWNFHQSEKVA